MLKNLFVFCLFILFAVPVWAEGNCTAGDQLPIKLMKAELKRGFKTYKKQKPPIYYLSYTYTEQQIKNISVATNGVINDFSYTNDYVEVSARAGSPKMDNTRPPKEHREAASFVGIDLVPVPTSQNNLAFRLALWNLTDNIAKKAQGDLRKVEADNQTGSERQDKSDDFVFPPKSSFCHMEPEVTVDMERMKDRLVRLSNIVRGNKDVLNSELIFALRKDTAISWIR